MFRAVLLIVAMLFPFFFFAQKDKPSCPEIENREAEKAYYQGIDRKKNNKEARMKFLNTALQLEPDYADANFAYAKEILVTQKLNGGSYKPAEPYFLKVVESCPKYHSDPYYYLGHLYYMDEKYDDAIKYLKQFLSFSDEDEKKFSKDYELFLENGKQMLKYAKFYSDIFKHPVPFDPTSVRGLSSSKDEYLPIISPDNQLALFTRKLPVNSKDQSWQSDQQIEVFSYSERKNGSFDEGKPMPFPFNKNPNEGGATLSIDNKHLFYTICKDEGGAMLNCDIYYSDFVDGAWTEIKNLGTGVNDPKEWDSQPSIAADGKTLYFASSRAGGLGGIDIYKTIRDATNKEWGTPVNMGQKINTSGNEKSPFIHSDSETLYFCSDGHPGIGGFDIFFIRKDSTGNWMEPKNIGYPINTESDDLGFFVSTDGKLGYFASNASSKTKGKTMGGWDIYSFDLYKEARPENVALIKGDLKDQGEQVLGATIEVKNARTKEKIDAVVDTTTGEYALVVNLKKKDDFIITVKKDGYAFNSQVISGKDSTYEKPKTLNFEVKPIQVGHSYTLNNIYYETNSTELKSESKIVVEEFADFLKNNPTVKIEIHGHTDNIGNIPENSALSTDRAFTVYDMILEMGISKSQIIAFRGFGANKPIADNSSEKGRAKNRRTEFLIIEK